MIVERKATVPISLQVIDDDLADYKSDEQRIDAMKDYQIVDIVSHEEIQSDILREVSKLISGDESPSGDGS